MERKKVPGWTVLLIVIAGAFFFISFYPFHAAFAQSIPAGPDNTYCLPGNIPKFGTNDGPATLPENCFYTAMSATPSPGSVVLVPVSSSESAIQTIVNNLQCGQTLQFQAGDSYDVSNLTFPAKSCDSNHWITVETSGYNELPAEGNRISPCWAGVASLPGRPSYPCPANGPEDVMAQLTLRPDTSINVSGDHYRFIGLEATRAPGATAIVYVVFSNQGASNIIYDRMWIHGDATDETQHGVGLSDSNHVAVIDSYIDDMHCISATGACSDAQAISGGTDTNTGDSGIYKIVDDYLEASGENILFGGGSSVDTPADIEVRRNYFFKPMIWNPSSTSYFGTRFVVKNLFELKNAQRVLLEGNVMQNVWAGFSQVGAAILLTPKSQAGAGTTNLCPLCEVQNIVVRYNDVNNSGQALQIANAPSDNGGWATAGNSYSIHDDIFDGLNYPTCSDCANYQNQVSEGGTPTSTPPLTDILHDVDINHLTEVTSEQSSVNGGFLELGSLNSSTLPQLPSNITIDNSIFYAGYWGPWSTGGGTTSCPYGENSPLAKFNACWNGYSFAGNILAGGNSIRQTVTWPSGNFFPADQPSIGFNNLNNGAGGDYTLAASSPYKGSATDGTDPGANIALVESYTANDLTGNNGTIVTAPAPTGTMFLSSSSLGFGSIAIGSSSPTQKITFSNDTTASATLTNLTIAPPFVIATNYCVANTTWNGTIAPESHCDMYVMFTPQENGTVIGTLSFSAGGNSFSAALSGTGIQGNSTTTSGGGNSGGGTGGTSGGGTTSGGGGGGTVSIPPPVVTTSTSATSTSAITSTSSLESLLQSLIMELDGLIAQESAVIVPQLTDNLTLGSVSDEVPLLQEFLDYNGYPVATSGAGSLGDTGTYFGSKTQSALMQFQQASGLPVTGFFGPLTRTYLQGKW